MPSHILVPLDGSAFSETILPHAIALAHRTGSKLILLQALEPVYEPIYGTLGIAEQRQKEQLAGLRNAQLASIHNYLSHIARQEELAEGLEVQTEVIEGNDPASCIFSYVQHDPYLLLIAMTTHGRSGVLRWLFGSVAAALIHTTPTPLLLLRPDGNSRSFPTIPAEAVRYQTVIVPLDGSSFAEQALEQVRWFASAQDSTLLLVSIIPPPNTLTIWKEKEAFSLMNTLLQAEVERRTQYLEQKAEPLRRQGLVVQTYVASGHPAEEILRLSTQHRPALLVMTTHGRNALQRLFPGSVAMKVLQAAHEPVLLIPGRSFAIASTSAAVRL